VTTQAVRSGTLGCPTRAHHVWDSIPPRHAPRPAEAALSGVEVEAFSGRSRGRATRVRALSEVEGPLPKSRAKRGSCRNKLAQGEALGGRKKDPEPLSGAAPSYPVLPWKWSSFRHYATAEIGPVEIESEWAADRRSGRTRNCCRFARGESQRPTSAKVGQMWGTVEDKSQMWATSPRLADGRGNVERIHYGKMPE